MSVSVETVASPEVEALTLKWYQEQMFEVLQHGDVRVLVIRSPRHHGQTLLNQRWNANEIRSMGLVTWT